MAEKSLEHLALLNEERKEYIYNYLHREYERHKTFDKENEFLDFAETMAKIPTAKRVVIETLEDSEVTEDVKLMACYVGFLTRDEAFWKQMIPITMTTAKINTSLYWERSYLLVA